MTARKAKNDQLRKAEWDLLISEINWDKGRIIWEWNEKPFGEEWAQLVGGVTPVHVDRLRRTYDRFGHVYKEYEGIYWSHFFAALDWDDAEMWLEGAIRNEWSVSEMRELRWATLGSNR